jgi:hypothetical protein
MPETNRLPNGPMVSGATRQAALGQRVPQGQRAQNAPSTVQLPWYNNGRVWLAIVAILAGFAVFGLLFRNSGPVTATVPVKKAPKVDVPAPAPSPVAIVTSDSDAPNLHANRSSGTAGRKNNVINVEHSRNVNVHVGDTHVHNHHQHTHTKVVYKGRSAAAPAPVAGGNGGPVNVNVHANNGPCEDLAAQHAATVRAWQAKFRKK